MIEHIKNEYYEETLFIVEKIREIIYSYDDSIINPYEIRYRVKGLDSAIEKEFEPPIAFSLRLMFEGIFGWRHAPC